MPRIASKRRDWADSLIPPDMAEDFTVETAEKRAIVRALKETEGNILAAGKLLRMSKSTMYRKMYQHGILELR